MPLATPRYRGGPADEAGRGGLREERADADQHHAGQDGGRCDEQQQRQAQAGDRQRAPDRGRVPKRVDRRPASGVVTIEGRNTK